jgi:probable HAF family extracellular repeat protein
MIRSTTVFAAIAACAMAAAAQTAQFIPLGDLPGGAFRSSATAISHDGLAIVGYSDGEAQENNVMPFLWTEAGGMLALGHPPLGTQRVTKPFGVSNRGNVIVGRTNLTSTTGAAWKWTPLGGFVMLEDLSGGNENASALAVSADGTLITGNGSSDDIGFGAILWNNSITPTSLGELPGGAVTSVATNISPDGTTIIGYSDSENGREAFRWTMALGMVGLGDLPAGSFHSRAYAVNNDGSIIAGFGFSDGDLREAMRWTEATGMEPLGDIPGGAFFSLVNSIDDRGIVAVGVGTSSASIFEHQAMIWRPAQGMRALREVLMTNYNLDLTAWTLEEAFDISGDGLSVVGSAINSDGNSEGFLIRFIPCQADLNADLITDFFDVQLFLNRYAAGNPDADFNADGNIDFFDLQDFLNAYASCG